jgi:hypothetical protein
VSERHSLMAFAMLVFAICYLASIAAILAAKGKYAEALGFGGLTTGLVGVLGTFRPKSAAVENAETVNQGRSE